MDIRGKAILKRFAPSYNEKDDNHIDILRRIGQHMNMGGCLLSVLDKQLMARPSFDSTTTEDRVYALIASLRDAAEMDEGASALLQTIGHMFVEGVHSQEEVLPRRQPGRR